MQADSDFLQSLPGIAPWLRNIALGKVVRVLMLLVSGWLLKRGWITNANEWVAVNADTVTGAIATVIAVVWSSLDLTKRKSEAVIATQYPAWVQYGQLNRPANWIDVQDAILAQKAAKKARPGNYPPAPPVGGAMALLLVFALLLSQSACMFWHGESATDRFVQANKEVSAGILESLRTIRGLQKSGILSNEKAVPAAKAFGRAMDAHRLFVVELLPYLQPDADGRERLVLPADGIEKLRTKLNIAIAVGTNLTNDPAILDLDSATRAGIQAVLLGVKPALEALLPLLAKLPKAKAAAPSLRDAVPTAEFSLALPKRFGDSCRSALLAFGECDTAIAQIGSVNQ